MAIAKGFRGDQYANFLTFTVTQPAVNTFTVEPVFSPIPRLISQGRQTIMEVIAIDFHDSAYNPAAGASLYIGMSTGPTPTGISYIDNPTNVFTRHIETVSIAGGFDRRWPIRIDLQDEKGKGALIAADRFFFWVQNTPALPGWVIAAKVRLYYRMVSVSLQEYIGIVQSQQSSG